MAEVDAHSQEEHFDVLTRTGQKTGISKPRQAIPSLSLSDTLIKQSNSIG
jgi:hypothetical protein